MCANCTAADDRRMSGFDACPEGYKLAASWPKGEVSKQAVARFVCSSKLD